MPSDQHHQFRRFGSSFRSHIASDVRGLLAEPLYFLRYYAKRSSMCAGPRSFDPGVQRQDFSFRIHLQDVTYRYIQGVS